MPLGKGQFFAQWIIGGLERLAVVGLKRLDHLIFEYLTIGEVEARHGNTVFLLHNNGQRVWAVPYPMSVPYPMG